jgi:hypothetical protein
MGYNALVGNELAGEKRFDTAKRQAQGRCMVFEPKRYYP